MPVGAQAGTPGAEFVEGLAGSRTNLRTFDRIGPAFDALARGEVGAVVIDLTTAARLVFRTPRFRDAFKIAGPALTKEEFGIVVKRGNRDLLDRINAALVHAEAAGIPEALAIRWLRTSVR